MKQTVLLLIIIPILIARCWAQPAHRGDGDIDFRRVVAPGAGAFVVTLRFPNGADLDAAATVISRRLRAVGVTAFQLSRENTGEIAVRISNVGGIDSTLRTALTGEGVVLITATRPGDPWLRTTVDRLLSELSLPLAVADTVGAITIARTRHRPDGPSVPLLPAKFIGPLDSAAARAGKLVRYEADREKLQIHLLDPAQSLDLGSIDSVRAHVDRGGVGYILSIHPAAGRKQAIADFTRALIGRRTVFTIDDRVVASPTIMSGIESADIDISFGTDEELDRVRDYAFLLSLRRLPARPAIVSVKQVN